MSATQSPLRHVHVWLTVLALLPAPRTQRPARSAQTDAPGTVANVVWSQDGKFVAFTNRGQRYRLELATLAKEPIAAGDDAGTPSTPGNRGGRRAAAGAAAGGTGRYVGQPSRGRQFTQVDSPDGQWEAHYRDWNVVLKNKTTDESVAITTQGNEKVHYGTASWVYGEELDERRAMWWSPDSKKLLFYEFDDSAVAPFHLVTGWSKINTTPYPEYYPKAGATNPGVGLFAYDLQTRTTSRIDAGGGPEEYLFNLRASPDGSVLMINWTDRLQHDLKVLGIDVDTGKCRVIVEEHQDTWQENAPTMRFLADGRRFLWATEKSGYTHYELRDIDGKLHTTVTSGEFQTGGLDAVDEAQDLVGFTAYSSKANPYYQQYHLAGLSGKGQRRVTTQDLHHTSFNLSPDKKWLVAQCEAINTPPSTALYATVGRLVTHLAEGDPTAAANLAEMFQFTSDDGRFEVYGVLYKPADFDPSRRYPLINALYGGPGSNEFSASYVSTPRGECQRGYLVVKVNNRGTGNRGKAFLGAAYLRLGDVDIQDHADAVRLLRQRPYVDGERVGIVGSSYGGYMAAMGIFKHPDVYAAAVASSAPTDWRNYDTIYTERYMSTPQLNQKGYDTGRAMTYVKDFKGKLLILHGMVDDNVHPSNAFQLIDALDTAGKSYESRFWPNSGHGLGRGSSQAQGEFFDRVLKPTPTTAAVGR